jgi:hypothetical protein
LAIPSGLDIAAGEDSPAAGAAIDGSAAGLCAKAGAASAPANNAAVNSETVRFISLSFSGF